MHHHRSEKSTNIREYLQLIHLVGGFAYLIHKELLTTQQYKANPTLKQTKILTDELTSSQWGIQLRF